MRLSPCQLDHPPTSSQGLGPHHLNTCPVLRAVRILERILGLKCSQLVGCRKRLQHPRQAGEHGNLQHPMPQEGLAVPLFLPVWLP